MRSHEHHHRCVFCRKKYDCSAAHTRGSPVTWPGARSCSTCRAFNARAVQRPIYGQSAIAKLIPVERAENERITRELEGRR